MSTLTIQDLTAQVTVDGSGSTVLTTAPATTIVEVAGPPVDMIDAGLLADMPELAPEGFIYTAVDADSVWVFVDPDNP
jgi:hypothetical protein